MNNRFYIFFYLLLFFNLVSALTTPSEYAFETTKLEKEFKTSPSNESMAKWYGHAQQAYEKFPLDITVASQYAYTHYLSQRNPADGIKILLPFMEKLDSKPEIALALWRIFNDGIINENFTLKHGTPWGLLLKEYETPRHELEMMRSYWAKYIPEEYPVPQWLPALIKKSKTDVDETQCLQIWKTILGNLNEYDLKQERVKFVFSQAAPSNTAQAAPTHTSTATEDSLESVRKELAVFSALPNTLEEIELTLNKITQYRRVLRAYPEIPGCKELEQSIGEYEAQVVNIAYQAYISCDFGRCLKNIKAFNEKHQKEDARILTVEIYCMQKSNSPTKQVLDKIDQLLKLDPNNRRAFMLKRILETQEELNQRE